MALITLSNIGHSFGSDVVLEGATLSIEPGEKIGLVGRNGSGKTTLLRVVLGAIEPQHGSVQIQKNARIGLLSQDPRFDAGDTVRDAAERAFARLHDAHAALRDVFDRMAEADEAELQRLLRRQVELEAEIEAEGGYAIDHRIDATLHGLGFLDAQFGLDVGVLSGGQRSRLGLARLLLEAPDLLLLDEPTNHLDIDGREWLETFLADEFAGAVVVVSHDRWLLDRVVTRIVEVEHGSTRSYPGSYHKFVELRRERKENESRVHAKQLDRIRAEESFIARYKAGQRAKQARGRLSKLERFKRDELVDRPIELDVMRLRLPRIERSGDLVLSAEGLSKQYEQHVLFGNLDFKIDRGERIGIVGPNGAGKTTLVRCLLGETEPDSGTVRLGSRVNPGFYRQLQDHLDLSLTIWQYLQSVIAAPDGSTRASEQHARDLAGAFLFSGDEQDKPLAELSGGERSRAVLAGLIGSAHNLLILDEPTNHLDIPSAERLEQALSRDGGFGGTLILITHDRALLESTCDRLLILDGSGGAVDFPGTWSEWAENRQRQADRRIDPSSNSRAEDPARARRREAAEQRATARADNDLAALSLAKLEASIEEHESRIREIDNALIDPDVYTNGKRCRELQQERSALVEALEPLEFEWSRRAD